MRRPSFGLFLDGLANLFEYRKLFGRYRDTRTRRNRTQLQVDAFAPQMEHIVDSYLTWSLATSEGGLASTYVQPEGAIVQEKRNMLIVDMFCECYNFC